MSRASVICRTIPICVIGFPKAEEIEKIKYICVNNGPKFYEIYNSNGFMSPKHRK